jgi:hypothetical protein
MLKTMRGMVTTGDVVKRRLLRLSFALATVGAMLLLSSCAPDGNPAVGRGEDPAVS